MKKLIVGIPRIKHRQMILTLSKQIKKLMLKAKRKDQQRSLCKNYRHFRVKNL